MRCLLTLTVLALMPGLAAGEGIAGFPGDIVPYPVDGQIVTGGYDHYESPPISSAEERVFMYQFAQFSDDLNFTSDPGFDNLAGFAALPIGQPLDFHLTTNLLYWDGTDPVSFSPAPPSTALTLSLGSGSKEITGTSVTGSLTTIQVSNSIGRLHTHLGATIGDGSPEGIYMIGMTLSMPGLLDSDPFAIMYNDLQTLLISPDPNDFALAASIGQLGADWTQEHIDTVLPEPSSFMLLFVGAAALLAVGWRRRVTGHREANAARSGRAGNVPWLTGHESSKPQRVWTGWLPPRGRAAARPGGPTAPTRAERMNRARARR